ncbi:hypothetical protein K523DRAFT_356901 [Schizophyllum commune Tattone D]|nr:hypothetical protein K523DRAFT_356901 [Schizophyllum commune Tattone D]
MSPPSAPNSSASIAPACAQTKKPRKFKSMQAYLKHKRGEGSPTPSPSPSPPPPSPPPPSPPPSSAPPIPSPSPVPSRAPSLPLPAGGTGADTAKSGSSLVLPSTGPIVLPNGFSYQPSASTSAIVLPNGLAYHPSRSIGAIEIEKRAAIVVASAEARRRDRSIAKSADAHALFDEREALRREREELEAYRKDIEEREAALVYARRHLKRRRAEMCVGEAADVAAINNANRACERQVRKVLRSSKVADAPSSSAAADLDDDDDDDDDELSNDEEDERRAKLIRAVKQEYEETGVPPPPMFDPRDVRELELYEGPDDENIDPEGDARKILGEQNVEECAGVAPMDVDEAIDEAPSPQPSTRPAKVDARYSPPRLGVVPSHLQGLNDREKAVNFELYRDQDSKRELKYLRAIVQHLRPPLPVKPKPQVRDPAVVLDNCHIPRNVFRYSARRKEDGKFLYRVLGFTESERFMVASPNAAFLPHVPDPDVVQRIRMRADRRFGAEDITLAPTYFLANYAPHLACIPARPLSVHHPSQIMWMEPEKLIEKLSSKLRDDHNAYILTAPAADQFHRVILPVCKRAGRYLDLCAQARKMPIVWTRGLKIALGHIFGYLKHIPAPRERALLMVRELQRLWLELKGMVNFVYDIQPILTGTAAQPEPVVTQWYIGAITRDPRDVLGLQRAGVPVWHVMDFDFAAREVLLAKDRRGIPAALQLVKMYTPEQMAETGRHPDNLPYIFEGLPTDPSRLKQVHRYTNLALSVSPAYQDDLAQVAGRDPYAHPAISNRVYGSSRLRPLEHLRAGGEGLGSAQRRIAPQDVKRDMPLVDLQQPDSAFDDGEVAPAVAFDFVEDHNPFADEDTTPMDNSLSSPTAAALATSKTPASDNAPTSALGATSTSSPASPSTSSAPSAATAPSMAAASTSAPPIASSSAPPPPPKSMPPSSDVVQWVQTKGGGLFKATGAIYQPVGVHGVPRPRDLSRHHKSDLPVMPRVWREARDEVQDNWRHDGAEKGDGFRTFPLPDAIVGSSSEAKIARFYQVWVVLEEAAIENARRVPRDPQVFQRHSAGMKWVEPQGQAWVVRREDLLPVQMSSATPSASSEPCLAASAQVWKDVLNAHTTFRAVGENRQAFLMAKVREIFGATINFDKVLATLSQPYIALGEVCTSIRPPSREIARGILWRLQELIFRKDLIDLDRRLRLIFITRVEEHQRLRMVFARETYGADILSIYGEGERDQGLVAQDWMERYPYVVALADIMLDWDEPLPRRVRDVLRTPQLSQREFEWMEKKVIQHYAAMLFAHLHRKVVGPARRSIATSQLRR